MGLISAAIGFGGGVATTRYLDNRQMDRIEEKLQNLRQVDEQIVHHLEHDSENIKINRGSIRLVGQILEGMIATFQKEDLHRSEFNSALASLQQSIHSIRQNIMKYQRIIECAFQHCLSIEALSHEGATEAYNSIKNKAKEKGLKTVISTARHLFESHLDFKIKSFGLRLFITVNLYREKFKLHIYLFYPFKIPNQQIYGPIRCETDG